jgi:hypothetical protein
MSKRFDKWFEKDCPRRISATFTYGDMEIHHQITEAAWKASRIQTIKDIQRQLEMYAGICDEETGVALLAAAVAIDYLTDETEYT